MAYSVRSLMKSNKKFFQGTFWFILVKSDLFFRKFDIRQHIILKILDVVKCLSEFAAESYFAQLSVLLNSLCCSTQMYLLSMNPVASGNISPASNTLPRKIPFDFPDHHQIIPGLTRSVAHQLCKNLLYTDEPYKRRLRGP